MPESAEVLSSATNQELIELLIDQEGPQLPKGLPEEIVTRGEAIVEPLCELLLREDLWVPDDEAPGAWAPIHAFYLLGLIGSAKATPALIELLHLDRDAEDIHNAGPTVLGRMGPEAFDSIEEFINDSEVDPVRRGAIGGGALVYIGRHHPEHRPRIAAFLVELLERDDEDLEFTTFLAVEVAGVDAPQVQAALEAALDRGAVDDFIIDLDELRGRMSGHGEPWHGRPSDYDLMAELEDMRVLSFSNKAIQGLVDQAVERYGTQDQSPPVSPPPSPLAPTPGRRKKRSAKEKAKRKQARKARNRKRR